MRNLKKSREGDADDSSSISRLPDEIILQILNKLIDLKTLCFSYLVSRRFSSIVLQVDAITISFTAPLVNPSIPDKNTVADVAPPLPKLYSYYGESFVSASNFLRKFKGVKLLCIELPPSHRIAIGNRFFVKWKVKFGSRVESFIFLSPNSVCDKDGFYLYGNGDDEEDIELTIDSIKQKRHISFQCLREANLWHMMLLDCANGFPKLEDVSIIGSGRRERLSLSGEKLIEVKEWLHSASKSELETELARVDVLARVSECYIPVLKLPVSGYVMKGVLLW
ncbi:F-box protein AUF2 [Lactuca sativa]|uniref:F-box protein AUF2 n=1 Tax=Lactuca sativa TaxID=4236 RepID=UPI000CD9B441|nr:F-box protein AUF2 [Lactuca sativa]